VSAQREQLWNAAIRFGLRSIQSETGSSGPDGQLLTAHHSLLTAGWRRLDYDVQGEWGFYLILDEYLKSPPESRRAAAGWGGDRFAVYEGPKGEALVASLSTWDTENDAREFFDAYVKRTQFRYPAATSTPDAESPASTARTFSTNEGTINIGLRGSRVLILEGLADGADHRALIKALWQ